MNYGLVDELTKTLSKLENTLASRYPYIHFVSTLKLEFKKVDGISRFVFPDGTTVCFSSLERKVQITKSAIEELVKKIEDTASKIQEETEVNAREVIGYINKYL